MRAKVTLTSKTLSAGYTQLTFQAVTGPENEEWAQYTPTLSLNMTLKPEIADKYEPGKMYYLDFSEVN